MLIVFPVYQLPQPLLDLVYRGALGASLPGEEKAQRVHAPAALQVLLPDGPADGGLVDGQLLGHIGQAQRGQVSPGAEEALLPAYNDLGAG